MFRDDILKVLEKRKQLDDNDPRLDNCWDELTDVLSANASDSIAFLNEATEDEVLYASEVFEDVAYKLQSIEYIKCLDGLIEKYPDIPIKESVIVAKKMMD